MATNITKQTFEKAQQMANSGQISQAWQTLAECGDNYAVSYHIIN